MTQATTALAAAPQNILRPPGLDPPRVKRRGAGLINLLYLPALLLFAVFTVYPLVSGIGFSFTNWDGYSVDKAFVAFNNYIQLFQDGTFRLVLINTFIYGIGSTVIQQVIGLALALRSIGRFAGDQSRERLFTCRYLYLR